MFVKVIRAGCGGGAMVVDEKHGHQPIRIYMGWLIHVGFKDVAKRLARRFARRIFWRPCRWQVKWRSPRG